MNVPADKIKDKLVHSDKFVFTLMRSIWASQLASWVDMGLGFVLFAFVHLTPFIATSIGAFVGGVINCYMNYKYTFHADDCSWRAVIIKYILVWTGSMLFNAYGTQLMYNCFNNWTWLAEIGFKPDGYYAAARLLVSFIVSVAWNFVMHRVFVYKKLELDNRLIALSDKLIKIRN